MRIVRNSGSDRVVDALHNALASADRLDIASPALSLFAFAELQELLSRVPAARLALPIGDLQLLGTDADRASRNRLLARSLARQASKWLERNADVRRIATALPQAMYVAEPRDGNDGCAITGACALTTDGIGLTPGHQFGLVQCAETPEEVGMLRGWFSAVWDRLESSLGAKESVLTELREIATFQPPERVYHAILYNLFNDLGESLDEEQIVKSATGIRDSAVWKKLYHFQRDGVIGAIDKLERLGGCIIADSVGLGKTFEALAVIKYYELRNDRVLVLCPKRLRENWTLYKANDRRNVLAADRLHYDVLNHTDLSRDGGLSGDIDLSHINWGNYDLVVIDESHNFRNKGNFKDRETRYDRLMRQIIRAGVKTRVLMLSATPVNNRLADLKNQIAFATEGNDTALTAHGIPSIEVTVQRAQAQFNKWLKLPEAERTTAALLDALGFDYFKLLDLLTIARSRKHIQKYYGTGETGDFPRRLAPINIKADVDLTGAFPPIRDINSEIRRLTLAAHAPLRYVLAHKKAAYDRQYSTAIRGGESIFRQADREESMVHLMRVNLLKRMESSVTSFALTVERQLAAVDEILGCLEREIETIEELSIDDIDVDDPAFEAQFVGRKVRVLLQDVDRVRWRQDLTEDRDRLATLLAAARQVDSQRDAKLCELRELIARKCAAPFNPGNRKVLVFTAFADTAEYLYRELAPWAHTALGVNAAIVTGAGANRTTIDGMRADFANILSAFSPRAKERPVDLIEAQGEIDLLIATDCISEGQNLQDCDLVVNYDIHWNPVRIIQRFGRVDRLGSSNESVQLANFWPNMELEEYINLEQRVSGRMVLLDISATGEENVIEQQSGDQMNDLEYRRKQLQTLQDAVIDLEDLSGGVSITDLTLNDYRVELARVLAERPNYVEGLPLGASSVVNAQDDDSAIAPGAIFCLRAAADDHEASEAGYPLAPHYLVYVGEDGSVALSYAQAKHILDRLKRLSAGATSADPAACARFDKVTRNGSDMTRVRRQLASAVASITGRREERAVASLFSPGGTHARSGEFAGVDDFEVIAWMAILPDAAVSADA